MGTGLIKMIGRASLYVVGDLVVSLLEEKLKQKEDAKKAVKGLKIEYEVCVELAKRYAELASSEQNETRKMDYMNSSVKVLEEAKCLEKIIKRIELSSRKK